MEINSYWLKMTGRCNIPKELQIDGGYKITAEGSIPSSTDVSNENGTFDRIYKFVPILVEIMTDKGEVIKAKDTRSRSAQIRRLLYRMWTEDTTTTLDHEEDYDHVMRYILTNIYHIREKANQEK